MWSGMEFFYLFILIYLLYSACTNFSLQNYLTSYIDESFSSALKRETKSIKYILNASAQDK